MKNENTPVITNVPTIEEYEQMLRRHDWYFMMSDDHSVWQSGNANSKRLELISKISPEYAEKYSEISKWAFGRT